MSHPIPIVLIHGIARFDWLHEQYRRIFPRDEKEETDRSHYFRGIATYLKDHGYSVFHASLSYAKRSEQRALELGEQLQAALQKSGADKLQLIAHSMGGLDARRLIISNAELAGCIHSLTTIGTPHWGSCLADKGLELGGNKLINLSEPLLDLSGFADLTTAACAEFNHTVEPLEAANAVRYRACASQAPRKDTFLPLRPMWDVVSENEGPNDGMVSVKSQLWVSELKGKDGLVKPVEQIPFPFPADHFNQTGWWDPSKRDREKPLDQISTSIDLFEKKIREMYLKLIQE